jgi:hypothetical protein
VVATLLGALGLTFFAHWAANKICGMDPEKELEMIAQEELCVLELSLAHTVQTPMFSLSTISHEADLYDLPENSLHRLPR